jgi:hypothetical protein
MVTFLKKNIRVCTHTQTHIHLESCGQWQIFSPSLESIESTLYVFSVRKASNAVKYKMYNFDCYEVPFLNNHFYRIYCDT